MPNVEAFTTQIPQDMMTIILKTNRSKTPDFLICVDEEIFPVHRDLLKGASPYFQCLFECNMQEAQTATLEVKDMNAHVVNTVIAYMYGVNISIEWDDVVDYLDIIEMWQMTELKDKLEAYIVSNIDTNDCLDWVFVTQKYHLHVLQLFLSNFTGESVCGSFLSLDIAGLKNVLTKDMVNKLNCYTTLEACMNWILRDEQVRRCHYIELLAHTEMSICSPRFVEIMLNVYTHKVLKGEFRKVWHYVSMLATLDSKHQVSDEVSQDYLLCIDGKICCFDFNEEEHNEVRIKGIGFFPLVNDGNLHWSSYCKTPHGIFICREVCNEMDPGKSEQTNRASCLKTFNCAIFDVPSGKQFPLPDIPEKAIKVSSAFMDGKIYVFLIQMYPHGKMMCLDFKNPMAWWDTIQAPFMYNLPKLHCIGDKIFALDFSGENKHPYAFHCYNTVLKTWYKLNCMPQCCISCQLRTVVVDNDILFYRMDGLIFKYSTKRDSWTTLTAVSATIRSKDNTFFHTPYTPMSLQKKILFCHDTEEHIDMYDMNLDKWQINVLQKPWGMLMYGYIFHGDIDTR